MKKPDELRSFIVHLSIMVVILILSVWLILKCEPIARWLEIDYKKTNVVGKSSSWPKFTSRKQGDVYVVEQWITEPYIGSVEVARFSTKEGARIYVDQF